MRGGPGKFHLIPNNTLAEGDIIRLLPGDTAPAFIELLPFDIVKDENSNSKVKVIDNEFVNYREILNKSSKFNIPESCKPEW